ncbi:tRNA (guanosine(46)-N7)-methyltransferase TrmB [Patescibacteria group bacterium]|nr:tRNA (guanosine(46)-N7)-methyltransferase TrmB [Patescibacteria group bacterium]
MPRKKQQKINEAKQINNIVDYTDKTGLGRLETFVAQNKPIVLELACGDGTYALSLAEIYPNKNFIGVDIQGERLWMGAKSAETKELNNVIFLRAHIDHLNQFFKDKSIDEIWITFPDPYSRKKQEKKRLTHKKFIKIYRQILKPKGVLHLKTDNDALFDYSVETLGVAGAKTAVCLQNIDKYLDKYPLLKIQTFFERTHRASGKNIHYLNCAFR